MKLDKIYTFGEQLEYIAATSSATTTTMKMLKEIDNPYMRTLWWLMYGDDAPRFDVDKAALVYRPAQHFYPGMEAVLFKAVPDLYLFFDINTKYTTRKKTELFIQLLEKCHPADARLLIDIVNRKSSLNFMTKKVIQNSFPDTFGVSAAPEDETKSD